MTSTSVYTWTSELWKAFDGDLLLGVQGQIDPGIGRFSLSPSSSGFSCQKMAELIAVRTSSYRKENSPLLSDWRLDSLGVVLGVKTF